CFLKSGLGTTCRLKGCYQLRVALPQAGGLLEWRKQALAGADMLQSIASMNQWKAGCHDWWGS
ncbi:MAG: hypothetical protein RR100_24160, partial [Comamonas sp.]